MKEFLMFIVIFSGFMTGAYVGDYSRANSYKDKIAVDDIQLAKMKKECEKSLPRDKVCKAEIKFVIEE